MSKKRKKKRTKNETCMCCGKRTENKEVVHTRCSNQYTEKQGHYVSPFKIR